MSIQRTLDLKTIQKGLTESMCSLSKQNIQSKLKVLAIANALKLNETTPTFMYKGIYYPYKDQKVVRQLYTKPNKLLHPTLRKEAIKLINKLNTMSFDQTKIFNFIGSFTIQLPTMEDVKYFFTKYDRQDYLKNNACHLNIEMGCILIQDKRNSLYEKYKKDFAFLSSIKFKHLLQNKGVN